MAQTLSQAIMKLSSPKATAARIAKIAKTGHARIMQTDPKPSDYVRRVDGVRGAPEENVRPDGVIIYTYARLQPIIDYAMEALRELSPVHSGEYRNAHTLVVGGKIASDTSAAMPGEDVYIINPLPYSRKIELGKMTMRVPGSDQVYDQAQAMVARRFGNQAYITSTFEGFEHGAVPQGVDPLSRKGGLRKNVSEIRFPCLRIRLR